MKRNCLLPLLAVSAAGLSCQGPAADKAPGFLSFRINAPDYAATRSGLPDTCSFLLQIADSRGRTVYDGLYGDAPVRMPLEADTYYLSLRSSAFEPPCFSQPLYGDDVCVLVPPGGAVDVVLHLRQVNAGVRLRADASLRERWPSGSLVFSCADGRLDYPYSETRTAYFHPGPVEIALLTGSGSEPVLSRLLEARDMLVLDICVAEETMGEGDLRVQLDTARNWMDETVLIGGELPGAQPESAIPAGRLAEFAGREGVWVCGYIAGCFKSLSSFVTEPPFPSATNLALSDRPSDHEKEHCASVELKKGSFRDAVNLADHPGLQGIKLYVKGDIAAAYYGIPGVKNVSDYRF